MDLSAGHTGKPQQGRQGHEHTHYSTRHRNAIRVTLRY
jgi:hypothetical protein